MRLGDPTTLEWHFFVPCRDEEAVIGGTITYLRHTFRSAHVWVVDDGSDDRTATVVRNLRRIDGRHIHLVQRYRPHARTGKGDALNAAYRALKAWQGRHAAPERAVVVVLDADGRLAPNCRAVAAAHFEDARLGAVQVDMRMNNVGTRPVGQGRRIGAYLARMQDMEFHARIPLGGNGKFFRLAALDSVAGPEGRPWRGLEADLPDWRTSHTRDTYVHRAASYSVRRILAQHSGRRPWLHLLGGLAYPIPLVLLGFLDLWLPLAAYGVLGLLPSVIRGVRYPRAGWWRGIGYGLGYAAYSYVCALTSWLAIARPTRSRPEPHRITPGVVALEH